MLFEGTTETVCVIGLVKVKVLGTVQNGERVYAAVHQPGVAIPETQIPLRAMAGCTPTLLGQALESKTSYKQDSVHLVHCFVSIVLGIQSGQLTNAINDLQERMQGRFEDFVVMNRSKWLKGIKSGLFQFYLAIHLTYTRVVLLSGGHEQLFCSVLSLSASPWYNQS